MKTLKKPFANILITGRDKDILRLLNRLKIAESRVLKIILSPETSQNTFSGRLLKLEERWYIQSINADRSRNQHKIYGLSNDSHKLKEIEYIIWEKTDWGRYTHSHTYFYHTLYISYLLTYLIERFRKKHSEYIFQIDDFISQFTIQSFINQKDTSTIFHSREKHMIPDWILKYKNLVIWIEVERTNSNKQFKEKLLWYEEQLYYLHSSNFSDYFDTEEKHSIIVMSPLWKITPYKQILETVKISDSYGINFIDEDVIIGSLK
jgi:hypothetical protein